jgi:hypothetical protein
LHPRQWGGVRRWIHRKLGPYYSLSEVVKGNKEGGMKMMTTTTKMATTETKSLLLPPPGRDTIDFVIGNVGGYNIDSWVFLRGGLFRFVA